MDTTQDISKVDQLSIVVRYAVITRSENGQLIEVEVKELFLGFYAAIKHGAADLVHQHKRPYSIPTTYGMTNISNGLLYASKIILSRRSSILLPIRRQRTVQRTKLCCCEVSLESVAMAQNINARMKEEQSGNVIPAHCVIR
ncbi:hypothetical protein EVAR_100274_1, partial [Eumeta japonica]